MTIRILLATALVLAPASARCDILTEGSECLQTDDDGVPSLPTYKSNKSVGTALGLSLGLTFGPVAAGIAMMAGGFHLTSGFVGSGSSAGQALIWTGAATILLGLSIGPSTGHLYAGGHTLRDLGLSGLRAILWTGAAAAAFFTVVLSFPYGPGDSPPSWQPALTGTIAVAALIAAIGLTGWDLSTVPAHARCAGQPSGVTVAPFLSRLGGSTVAGLGLRTAF
jgi:hypothetical protein